MSAAIAKRRPRRETADARADADVSIFLPTRVRRRLDGRMADERPASSRFVRRPGAPWTSERIAQELVPIRDQLIRTLPREIAAARDLTLDQRELVIDDAIDFMVTQYAKPVTAREELDRAFWASASFRVKRAHEGRSATVRGGFRRAAIEDLDHLAGGDDPEAAVVRRDEQLTLLEFVTTLTPRERDVFACKYGSGASVAGRSHVSRWLNLPIGEVRKAERNIELKLKRFITIVAAGALCSYRSDAILSLATATADQEQATAARLHLKHCPACRGLYADHLRALRSGDLQRKIAGLLPLPTADRIAEDRPVRGFLVDWLTRPFSGEPAAMATQAVSSGTGRGLGTLAALKLASLCIGGAALTGGTAICVSLLRPDQSPPLEQRQDARKPQPSPSARRVPDRVATETPTPAPQKVAVKKRTRSGATGPRKHERTVAVSPPPEDAQAGGVDEFGPSSASQSTTPAAAPSGGASEFP